MRKERIKRIIIISSIIIILGLSYILYNKFYIKDTSDNVTLSDLNNDNTQSNDNESSDDNQSIIFVVEIKGCVYYPGCYTFTKSEVIVQDVIDMAGGLTSRADISDINCAALVENHSYIYIGSKEAQSYVLKEDEKLSLININTCTKEDFMTLPGIGDSKAQAIVDYREQNGYFKSTEDLKNVSGIGESLYNKIKGYITV